MKNNFYILLFLSIILFGSCVKQAPQIPANKGIQVDSAAVSMLEINKRLAAREDSLLKLYVDSQHSDYIKSKIGFWYKINFSENSTLLKDKFRINYHVFLLDGKQIESESKEIVLGKRQLVDGLEEGLKLLHKGDSATFIIPWYLAYGMQGDEKSIPPYTSLIFRLKIDN